jgi:hypothetical protein
MNPADEQLRATVDRLLAVGRAEGIEVDGPLGAWLEAQAQALLGLANVLQGQGEAVGEVLSRIEAAAAAELRNLKEAIDGGNHVVRQAEVAVRAARQAQIGVVVERQHLVDRMVKETLPMFADKLQGALVIREETWNAKKRDRRFAAAAAVAGVIFMAGYCFSWWQDSGQVAAYQRCVAHPVEADGQIYCQASGLFGPAKVPPGSTGG